MIFANESNGVDRQLCSIIIIQEWINNSHHHQKRRQEPLLLLATWIFLNGPLGPYISPSKTQKIFHSQGELPRFVWGHSNFPFHRLFSGAYSRESAWKFSKVNELESKEKNEKGKKEEGKNLFDDTVQESIWKHTQTVCCCYNNMAQHGHCYTKRTPLIPPRPIWSRCREFYLFRREKKASSFLLC